MTDKPQSPIVAMVAEAISSKKFVTMASALGLSWATVDRFAGEHPQLACVVISGASLITCCYILGQSYVDAKKP